MTENEDENSDEGGGFVVCRDGRLQPVGTFADCFKPGKDAGQHIAVRLVRRQPVYGLRDATGYWAEIVITGPVGGYKGPPSNCLLPPQFDRFKKQKPKKPDTA